MFSRLLVALMLGLVASLFVGTAVMATESFDGKVLTVSEDHHLTISQQEDQRTFVVDDDTKFTLDGEAAHWEDMQPGFTVMIQADRDGDRFLARSIAAFADE